MNLALSRNKLLTYGMILIGLSAIPWYFLDPFYFPFLLKILVFFGFIFLGASIFPRKISIMGLIIYLYILFYNYSGFLTHFHEQQFNSLHISGLILILFFVFVENIENKMTLIKTLNILISIFVIFNLISLFVFILFTLKFPLPFTKANFSERGFLYTNFAGILIVCNYITFNFGDFILTRFNGVFVEPGILGTYCGMFLMVNAVLFPAKKFRTYSMIIFGVISMSFAFYIFLFFYLLFTISFKRMVILSIIIPVIISLIIGSLPKQSLDYISKATIERFAISDGKVAGDTRGGDNVRFQNYLNKASASAIIFGNGKFRNQDKSASYSSYAAIIYESGFLGMFLMLFIHFYYLIYQPLKHKYYKYILITILPILSIYQGRQGIDFLAILYFLSFKFYFEEKGLIGNQIIDYNIQYAKN